MAGSIARPDEASSSFADAASLSFPQTAYMNSFDDVDVFRLPVGPGVSLVSVLPDLIQVIYPAGSEAGGIPSGVPLLTEETLAYPTIYRKVITENGDIQYSTYASLEQKTDDLAMSGRNVQPGKTISFYSGNTNFEAAKTSSYTGFDGVTYKTQFTDEYYIQISGQPIANLISLTSAEGNFTEYAGRYLITVDNPTGQRSAAWGGWIDTVNAFDTPGQQPQDPGEQPQVPSDPSWYETGTFRGAPPSALSWDDPSGTSQSPTYSESPDGSWTLPDFSNDPDAQGWDFGQTREDLIEHIAETGEEALIDVAKEWLSKKLEKLGISEEFQEMVERVNDARDLIYNFHKDKLELIKRGFDLDMDPREFDRLNDERDIKFLEDADGYLDDHASNSFTDVPLHFQTVGSFRVKTYDPGATIEGGSMRDFVVGGSGSETVMLGSGRDTAVLGGGDDTVHSTGVELDFYDGGSGRDTVVYEQAHAIATITRNNSSVTVASVGGSSDELVDIERIKFTDGNLAFDTGGSAGEMYRLYQAAFARDPDAEGLGYWIREYDQGQKGLAGVAFDFMLSNEFKAKYGSPETVSDEAFLNLLYRNVLGRDADGEGKAYLT